jgi:hypothetical protein
MDFEQIHIVVFRLFLLYNLIFSCLYSHYIVLRRGNCAFRLLYFRVNFWKIKDSKCILFFAKSPSFTNIFAIFPESYLLAMAICSFLFCLEFVSFLLNSTANKQRCYCH